MAGDPRSERRSASASELPPPGPRPDWPALLAEHGRWLRTIVLARVSDHAAADDVMQEVALATIEKGHQLRDVASAAPWLYRLAVMTALQHRRRSGRRRGLIDRYAARTAPDEDRAQHDPLDWLLAHEQRGLVRQALQRLAPRDAEILLLKYTEDWSYQHIAKHLGLSTSAVEARLHRARGRLRQALARLDPTMAVKR